MTMGILLITLVSWVMFERSNYTLLSYVSNVLLLLLSILFLWAKSAQILNRPTPPIPHLQLSEETMNEAAALFRDRINTLLSISYDIALGKDPKMFVKVAAYLVLISLVGSLTDFRTLCYTSKLFYPSCICKPLGNFTGKTLGLLPIGQWFEATGPGALGGVFLVLTVPASYERYEEHVDSVLLKGNMKLKQLYIRFDEECIKKVRKWILEKNKL
ncbi:hypothetical protein OSB04_023913, partial [Centaurea solstitialis]